jgi:outer membrane protein assembly factor BamD
LNPYLVDRISLVFILIDIMTLGKVSLVFLLVVILILGGCLGNKEKKELREGPDELYTRALSRFNRKKYESAIELFKDVKNYYPESPEALRAEIKIADSHFFLLEYEEAIALYEEFRKLHPNHEDIPYVLFQIGQGYFKQITTPDRDQNPARRALLNFQYLVENYPPSIFTETAKEKIVICRQSLAEHEFLVGRFYLRKRNYPGAIGRFEVVLLSYPDTEVVPKALFYMGKAFMNLSLDEKARTAFLEITHRYPSSEYAAKADTILKTEWNETGASPGWKQQSGESTVPAM